MWIVLARQPRPLAEVWVGRGLLTLVDAIVWPAAWVVMVSNLSLEIGLLGPVCIAVALLFAVRGVSIAVWHNEQAPWLEQDK